MKIDLLKLKLNQVKKIDIDDTVKIEEEYLGNSDIKDITDVKVNGKIVYHGEDIFELILNIKTELTMPCSVTLEDVIIPIDINITENLSYDEDAENNKIINNTIDLIPIIWQNIILEVPLKVISPNVDRSTLHGDGWKLITEEEDIKEEDPRLEKLKEFLNDNKEGVE